MIWLSVLLFMQASAPDKQIERGQTLFLCGDRLRHVSRLEGRARPSGRISGLWGGRRASGGHRHPRLAHGIRRDHKAERGRSVPGHEGRLDGRHHAAILRSVQDAARTAEIRPGDVESKSDNSIWKHPPSTGTYTNQQIADIVAYVRWAATGERKAVDPSDVE
jgi:hypothetical protein